MAQALLVNFEKSPKVPLASPVKYSLKLEQNPELQLPRAHFGIGGSGLVSR